MRVVTTTKARSAVRGTALFVTNTLLYHVKAVHAQLTFSTAARSATRTGVVSGGPPWVDPRRARHIEDASRRRDGASTRVRVAIRGDANMAKRIPFLNEAASRPRDAFRCGPSVARTPERRSGQASTFVSTSTSGFLALLGIQNASTFNNMQGSYKTQAHVWTLKLKV